VLYVRDPTSLNTFKQRRGRELPEQSADTPKSPRFDVVGKILQKDTHAYGYDAQAGE
jgi:hypothetical protein